MLPYRPLFFLLLLLAACTRTAAQSYNLHLHSVDGVDALLQQQAGQPKQFANGIQANEYIRTLIPALQEKGYLAASVDSLSIKGADYDAWIYLGRGYRWANISFASIPPALITAAAIMPGQWVAQPLNPKQLSRVSERLLVWCENNGYPFARVWLDSIQIDTTGGVYGNLIVDRGTLRHIDSFYVDGDARISKSYLMRYLDIHEGEVYSERKMRTLTARLRELSFIEEDRPWSIAFKSYDTRLTLDLKTKKANQLNLLIGLQPNTAATGKFLLTGDAQAAFQNLLGKGESFGVHYENLQAQSPSLKADFLYPYLFNTAIGAEAHFDLYKKDSSYRRVSLQAGGRYQVSATDYIRVFYENQSNRLITIDTAIILSTHKLPDNVDVSANGVGVEAIIDHTDYRLNPRKGWTFRLSSSVLLRHIEQSNAILSLSDASGFNFASLYDTLSTGRSQYRINGDVSYYLPLGRRATLRSTYAGGWIGGTGRLFQNELYQIGGFRLLRGFDELSIYTNQYHIASLELRLLLSRNSNIYLFSDNGWAQTRYSGVNSESFYNGFGLGTTLQTKGGIFTIAVGVGRSNYQQLKLGQSKVHFGYVAYF